MLKQHREASYGFLSSPETENMKSDCWEKEKNKKNRLEQFVPDDRAAEGDGGERGAQCLFLYLCMEGFKNNILLCCSYVTTTQQKNRRRPLFLLSFLFYFQSLNFRCLHPESPKGSTH